MFNNVLPVIAAFYVALMSAFEVPLPSNAPAPCFDVGKPCTILSEIQWECLQLSGTALTTCMFGATNLYAPDVHTLMVIYLT